MEGPAHPKHGKADAGNRWGNGAKESQQSRHPLARADDIRADGPVKVGWVVGAALGVTERTRSAEKAKSEAQRQKARRQKSLARKGKTGQTKRMKERPVVLIHGYPFDHTLWYGVIAAMGTGVRVIAPDLPGFGRTPVLESEPSMDVYADYILEQLVRNNAESAFIAGMSMGGYVALAFAERYPERVAGLGLISTQAAADTEQVRAGRAAVIQKVEHGGPSAAAQALAGKMFSPTHAQDPELARVPFEGAERAGVRGITWALRAMASRPDRTDVVKKLAVPGLVVHGTEDQVIPVERARAMAALLNQPHFLEIKKAGHCTPLEAPDPIAEGLARLIQRARTSAQEPVA